MEHQRKGLDIVKSGHLVSLFNWRGSFFIKYPYIQAESKAMEIRFVDVWVWGMEAASDLSSPRGPAERGQILFRPNKCSQIL